MSQFKLSISLSTPFGQCLVTLPPIPDNMLKPHKALRNNLELFEVLKKFHGNSLNEVKIFNI